MANTLPPFCSVIPNNTALTVTLVVTQQPAISDEEYLNVKSIFDAGMLINQYYLWPLFVLGFPGNCAAIITIFRMRSCIGTFPVFVVMLAIMDSLAIFVKLLFFQLLNHKVIIGTTGCCLFRFLGSWTSAYSSWILVFMALERFAAVRFPLKVTLHQCCSAHKVLLVLLVVGLVLALIYMPQLWTSHIIIDPPHCAYKSSFAHFMNNVYFWISAAVYAFVPFCLLTLFNCLIARQIHSSLKVRSVMRNLHLLPYSQGCFDLSIQRQVNLMLLSATAVFVILTFPICIFMVADYHWKVTPGYTHSNAIKFMCQQVAFVLVDSTHAVNFYLYFLSARRFRHHFLRLVTCKTSYCSLKTLWLKARANHNNSEVEDL